MYKKCIKNYKRFKQYLKPLQRFKKIIFNMTSLKNILLNKNCCKSVWFMRQAGRYYLNLENKEKNKDFIKLCLNSELSSIITLQPIKRFNLNSAIIFSDILMVPYALGQKVTFIQDKGPNFLNSIKNFLKK